MARPPRRDPEHPIRSVLYRVSPRGYGLAILGGVGSIGRGVSYVGTESLPYLGWVERLAPLDLYIALWCLVGAASIAVVVLGQTRRADLVPVLLPWAFGANVLLNGLWSISFLYGQITDGGRLWVTAMSYGMIAYAMHLIAQMIDPPDVAPAPPADPAEEG